MDDSLKDKTLIKQVNELKTTLLSLVAQNKANLEKYGKTFIIRCLTDIENVEWDLVETDNLLIVVSFNPNNSRLEFDYFMIKDEVFKHLSYIAYSTNKQITELLRKSDGSLHIFNLFFTPLEKDVDWHNYKVYKDHLINIRPNYPLKYSPLISEVIIKSKKSVHIICNNSIITDHLQYYGWNNIQLRETKFAIC